MIETACAPALLDVDCKTVEHMRLAKALCRFVELAFEVVPTHVEL